MPQFAMVHANSGKYDVEQTRKSDGREEADLLSR